MPPPAVLKDSEQVSFNDLILDAGGIVRRGLLFLDDGQNVFYSFALRLVLPYLEDQNIVPEPDPNIGSHIRLGARTIRPFETNDGGYVDADAWGYQFLLDFHGAPEPFPSYTFTELMSGKIDPDAIQNKIVILGVTLIEGHKDFFFSPYSSGQRRDQRMAGITLHAHVASQLLRAALGERAMMTTFPDWQEAIWCLLWSVLGGGLDSGLVTYGALFPLWPVVSSSLGWWLMPAWRMTIGYRWCHPLWLGCRPRR